MVKIFNHHVVLKIKESNLVAPVFPFLKNVGTDLLSTLAGKIARPITQKNVEMTVKEHRNVVLHDVKN